MRRPRTATPLLSVLVAAAVVFGVASARAEPGALDRTFGSGGIVTTGTATQDENANAVAVQPNGKIVAAGARSARGDDATVAMLLARYNRGGSLDAGFGSRGTVTGPSDSIATAIAVQPDGKIVAAGLTRRAGGEIAVARYVARGSLDASFGSGGSTTIGLGLGAANAVTVAVARALALQPDGKIVVAGYSYEGNRARFTLARLNPDGSLDATFGTAGRVTTEIGDFAAAYALVLQPDGRLVAAGSSSTGARTEFALARYNRDGSLDSSFGTGGIVTTPIGPRSDNAYSVAVQPDGKIVAAGESERGADSSRYDFALARYHANGSLDLEFGTGGKATAGFDTESYGYALVVQPNGKIVLAGPSYRPDDADHRAFALARFNRNGTLDTGFATGGKVRTPIGADSPATALVLQPDGKLLAAGRARIAESNVDVALARYEGDSNSLKLVKRGKGKGSVASTPAGVACGRACRADFATASRVTLTAKAARGSTFAGWRGACSGKRRCTVTMSANRSVVATFRPKKARPARRR